MTPDKLNEILERHELWLSDPSQGERANLTNTNLINANLEYVNLAYANLANANLTGANLFSANLTGANLANTNLFSANLTGADLTSIKLTGAYLVRSNLANARLPYPIYQFYAGRYHGVATPLQLRIGCEIHPWDVWLDDIQRKEIAAKAGFSEREYDTHTTLIRTYHQLLCGEMDT